MTRRMSMLLVVLAMLTIVGCRQAAETPVVEDQSQQGKPEVALEDTTPVVYKVTGMT